MQLTESGHIRVNRVARTSMPSIYAAGDCSDFLPLASVASMQGRTAVFHALGDAVSPTELRNVTSNIFTAARDRDRRLVAEADRGRDRAGRDLQAPARVEPARQDDGDQGRLREDLRPHRIGDRHRRRRRRAEGERPHPAHRARDRAPAHGRSARERVQRCTRRCRARSPTRRARCTSWGSHPDFLTTKGFPCRVSISVRTSSCPIAPMSPSRPTSTPSGNAPSPRPAPPETVRASNGSRRRSPRSRSTTSSSRDSRATPSEPGTSFPRARPVGCPPWWSSTGMGADAGCRTSTSPGRRPGTPTSSWTRAARGVLGVPAVTPPTRGGTGPSAPGFMTRGVEAPDSYYYRRVFTDAVRAVDAVRGFERVDPERVAVAGGSQGGGIALAVGGLTEGLLGVLPEVPFLCHFERAVGLTDKEPFQEIVRYLAVHRDAVERTFATLSYFDGVNFAKRATAPALFSVGLLDPGLPTLDRVRGGQPLRRPGRHRGVPVQRARGRAGPALDTAGRLAGGSGGLAGGASPRSRAAGARPRPWRRPWRRPSRSCRPCAR